MENIGMFPTVGSIVVICYIIAQTLKLTQLPTKYLPIITAILGGALALGSHYAGVPELDKVTVLDAIAMGVYSGLASNGAYSFFKNVSGAYEDNDLSKKDQILNQIEGKEEEEIGEDNDEGGEEEL